MTAEFAQVRAESAAGMQKMESTMAGRFDAIMEAIGNNKARKTTPNQNAPAAAQQVTS